MNSLVTTITSRSGAAGVQALLDQLAASHGLQADVVADMQVALDEILSNILRNGFADGLPHRIDVTLFVDGGALRAEVEDDCAPFDPLGIAPPERGIALQDRRVGGLGVHFVRNLMSEVSYVRCGARNRLMLGRSLDNKRSADGVA